MLAEYLDTFHGKTVVKESVYLDFLGKPGIPRDLVIEVMNQARHQILPRKKKMKMWFGAMSFVYDEFWNVFASLEDKKHYFPDGMIPKEGDSMERTKEFFEKVQNEKSKEFIEMLEKLGLKK